MICTGGIPPHVTLGMEMYQNYMRSVMEMYRAYCYLSGVAYWSDYMKAQYQQYTENK